MAKKIKAYNLDEEMINYVRQTAKYNDRSASAQLNHLLTQLALQDKLKKKV